MAQKELKKAKLESKKVSGSIVTIHCFDKLNPSSMKCTRNNWTGIGYKIPRSELNNYKDNPDFKKFGIYILTGTVIKDESSKKDDKLTEEEQNRLGVYIGQAGLRANNNGILTRMIEHTSDGISKRLDWDTMILFVTSNDCLGPSELNYLEYKLWDLASFWEIESIPGDEIKKVHNNNCTVRNKSKPDVGNPSDQVIIEMSEFIDNIKLIMNVFNYDIFNVPQTYSLTNTEEDPSLRELHSKNYDAYGYKTVGGFMIKKGSKVWNLTKIASSCPSKAVDYRAKYSDYIDKESGNLTNDLLLPDASPSSAASFLTGTSISGNVFWYSDENKPLLEYSKKKD